jgi:hypothetical protein
MELLEGDISNLRRLRVPAMMHGVERRRNKTSTWSSNTETMYGKKISLVHGIYGRE